VSLFRLFLNFYF